MLQKYDKSILRTSIQGMQKGMQMTIGKEKSTKRCAKGDAHLNNSELTMLSKDCQNLLCFLSFLLPENKGAYKYYIQRSFHSKQDGRWQ